ncbi:MAG: hypothetical protein ACUVWK_02660 [Nitrososphaerales archaeon]
MRELQSMINSMKVVYGALAAVIADYDVRTLYIISSEDTTISYCPCRTFEQGEEAHIIDKEAKKDLSDRATAGLHGFIPPWDREEIRHEVAEHI